MSSFPWKRLAYGLLIGLVVGCVIGVVSGVLRNEGYRSISTVLVIMTPTFLGGIVLAMWGRRAKS